LLLDLVRLLLASASAAMVLGTIARQSLKKKAALLKREKATGQTFLSFVFVSLES
jgi:hypothetical protein